MTELFVPQPREVTAMGATGEQFVAGTITKIMENAESSVETKSDGTKVLHLYHHLYFDTGEVFRLAANAPRGAFAVGGEYTAVCEYGTRANGTTGLCYTITPGIHAPETASV